MSGVLAGGDLPAGRDLAGGRRKSAEIPQQLALFDMPRRKPAKREVRPMMTARSELRPLYLNTQGVKLGKSGAVLQVKDKEKLLQEVRIGEICQVNLMGNVQITTQAVQALCEAESSDLLLFDGRVVLRHHAGLEYEERVPAAQPVPAGGAGVISRGRSRGGWWRGRFAIRERCCSGITWNRIGRRWRA